MYKADETIIIFDYMRTLYDPDSKTVIQGAFELLDYLRAAGFILYLITRPEGQRIGDIRNLGLDQYFKEIIFTSIKEDVFRQLRHRHPGNIIVIGDRIKGEIWAGNIIGAHTIWFKNGKFSDELPSHQSEFPQDTVISLRSIIDIIER